ncbi:MAG TPA: hypothetical protein VGB76_02950 [Pyrinomonadaceae bacterium]
MSWKTSDALNHGARMRRFSHGNRRALSSLQKRGDANMRRQ